MRRETETGLRCPPGAVNDPKQSLQRSMLAHDNPSMEPRDVVRDWVAAFNRADADEIAGLYADDAINHQVVQEPVVVPTTAKWQEVRMTSLGCLVAEPG